MKRFKTVSDVLPPDVSAIVIFTRGHLLVFGKDGEGYTGNWKMNPTRDFEAVLLYLRGERQDDNTLYVAEATGIEPSNEEGRYRIYLADIRKVGVTSSNWHRFVGSATTSPVIYTSRKA